MLLTFEYLTRTLRIRHVGGPGAAVLVTVRDQTYLITARHVVETVQAGENLLVRRRGEWHQVRVERLRVAEADDIAVLVLPGLGGPGLRENLMDGRVYVGQAAAYGGYPLGLEGLAPDEHDWPIPLVKSAIYSGAVRLNGTMVFLFDTVNNNGFSGGPVWVEVGGVVTLAAIVSGYHYDRAIPVMRPRADGGEEPVPDLTVKPNSGFMKAVPIQRAVELISALEAEAAAAALRS